MDLTGPPMNGGSVTREVFDDLSGAYALDAVEPDEANALDEYIARDDAAARETERLREAASWLGAIDALEPPLWLRARVLAGAAERPSAATPAEAFAAETERLDALLGELGDDELGAVTHNGLSISDLVVHLAAIDAAFASEMTHPSVTWLGAAEVVEITADALPAASERSYPERRRVWRDGCRTLLDAAAATDQARAGGYAVDDVLVIRAFEAWVHHEDIRRATGRPAAPPAPAVLRSMADLSARALPAALAVTGVTHPGRTARLVLTGAGGGEWMVPLAPGETPAAAADVEIRLPAIEWCMRVAERVGAGDLAYDGEGDTALARDAVLAAPAFAGL